MSKQRCQCIDRRSQIIIAAIYKQRGGLVKWDNNPIFCPWCGQLLPKRKYKLATKCTCHEGFIGEHGKDCPVMSK